MVEKRNFEGVVIQFTSTMAGEGKSFVAANLALAWILGQGELITLLSGSTTVDQIRENARSAELELEPGDVAMMRDMAEALDR